MRLYFALMIVGCEQELAVDTVIAEGRAVLASFVGESLAALVFTDLERSLPKLTDRATLRTYLEEGLRVWLPK